jgi:5-(carboxyamino)imidazole ribonucleotide synthase
LRKKKFNEVKIGVLGGGQLGKMLLQEAYNYNLQVSVLDPSPDAPCCNIAPEFIVGDFKDFETVYRFGKNKDIITIEFEDVNTDALEKLESDGVKVFPQPSALRTIQDKGLQKLFYQNHRIPTQKFELIETKKDLQKLNIQLPVFQKVRKSGYDGYGVKAIRSNADIEAAFDLPSVIEEKADLLTEISVLVARNENGEVQTFPTVEMEFNPEANVVEFLFAPAQITPEQDKTAQKLAIQIIESLKMTGLLAVEMFINRNGEVIVNEVAPRPHNSGHHTIEGNFVSQYEILLRTLLNLPLGNTDTIMPAVMVNLLGEKGYQGKAVYKGIEDVLKLKGTYIHLYGKTQTKPFRKMGHVTILNENLMAAKDLARIVKTKLKVIAED